MYSVGDTVVYSTQGVCTIKDISIQKLGKVKDEYYILVPVADSKSVIYIPTGNEKLLSKMRPVMTVNEADALIEDAATDPVEWIGDDISRKSFCDEAVKSGSRKELMRLIGMLYLRREDLKAQKKNFHNVDAQYLKTAERMLHDELAYVYGISAEEVPELIRSKLEK